MYLVLILNTKMIINEKLIIFILVLHLVCEYGSTIKCHVCNSKENSNCLDPFNATGTLQECESIPGQFGGGLGGRTLDVIEVIMQSLEVSTAETETSVETSASVASPIALNTSPETPVMLCQKIVVIVGNETIMGRGCSPRRVDGMHPCDAVKLSTPERAAPAVHVRRCVTCPANACNTAKSTNHPCSAAAGLIVVLFLLRFISLACANVELLFCF